MLHIKWPQALRNSIVLGAAEFFSLAPKSVLDFSRELARTPELFKNLFKPLERVKVLKNVEIKKRLITNKNKNLSKSVNAPIR